MKSDPSLQAYFAEAASWDLDRVRRSERSLRVAWRVAFAATFVTVCFVVVLLFLLPLKTVEPFVIRVDNTTGIVDVVPIYTGQAGFDETATRYLLRQYVTICLRFNLLTAESDYNDCGALHSARRNQEWLELWTKSNPNSPLNLYRDGTTVRTEETSITFLKRSNGVTDLAQVRYIQTLRSSAGTQVSHWIATIQFAFSKPSKDPRKRNANPFGFKVVEFHTEPEVPPETQPTPSSQKDTVMDRSAARSPS